MSTPADIGALVEDDTSTVIVVNEIFGPTVQGEGPSAGRRCAFLRLGGCNLSCRWCDTPYTWDWQGVSDAGTAFDPRTELRSLTAEQVLGELIEMAVPMVVISGGEPLNQQNRILPVVRGLRARGIRVEIETNGTVAPCDELVGLGVRFNVSPKLAHSGDPEHRRIKPAVLKRFHGTADVAFKFVCTSSADLAEVGELQDRIGFAPVWIMPEGKSRRDITENLEALADEVVRRGWNLTTRLHVLAWGDQRGV
ncbi:7-carboxy-7-deazaguanine synthase QueE [Streptantibioticus rubrisoli]|uniref:7-carboxy-7-deazaguanine synthase n=1 Tax=Streptantibioticus rubrisoli TaxID=1387313 RepID=A0ABT1P593_9ACTN|nr:7-carboxy-7-deazaguanine synthase QueE [Streptantibioticus rubrisoli]MCQ4040525.1 7-carboxy-7-deazaguanine synthase QueE [Streptantibioticus rubrisoli]